MLNIKSQGFIVSIITFKGYESTNWLSQLSVFRIFQVTNFTLNFSLLIKIIVANCLAPFSQQTDEILIVVSKNYVCYLSIRDFVVLNVLMSIFMWVRKDTLDVVC